MFSQLSVECIWNMPPEYVFAIIIVLVTLLGIIIYRKFWNTPQVAFDQLVVMTKSELARHDGNSVGSKILTAVYGDIYDVSTNMKDFGPEGCCAKFVGREAQVVDFDPPMEDALRTWYNHMDERYTLVGYLNDENTRKLKESEESSSCVAGELAEEQKQNIEGQEQSSEEQEHKSVEKVQKTMKKVQKFVEKVLNSVEYELKSENVLDKNGGTINCKEDLPEDESCGDEAANLGMLKFEFNTRISAVVEDSEEEGTTE